MSQPDPRIQPLFLAALELPPQRRGEFLDSQCGQDAELRRRLDQLLEAHLASGFLQASDTGGPTLAPSRVQRGVTLAGRYRLLELIGEGGMGAVWLAEQSQPVRRKVAIKLIKPGMDSRQVLARFEAERQALALMDHPSIAKIYDGGVTEEGRPFFAMEYVKGIPITEYCDRAKLPISERLKLFLPVCQAVQHAHQKGVIHRDLKPSNILVCLYDGQPAPKVIDFGLAKAVSQPLTEMTLFTAHGVMVGTPLYMSPEQAEFNNLDVDTRSDVYSLGVILYELLTGATPLEKQQLKQAAFAEVLRLIKEEEPPRPSTRLSASASLPALAAQRGLAPAQLSRLVRGDLDWIVMKSLEKERGRRYETASGLARDVERYLQDEPVEACPPTLGYRLRKSIRKNQRLLATGAAIGTICLVALLGVAASVGWALRDQQARRSVVERRVEQALDDAAAAVKRGSLDAANEAVNHAQGVLATATASPELEAHVRQWKTDLELVRNLDAVQLEKARRVTDQGFDRPRVSAQYARAFHDAGYDPLRDDFSRLTGSPIQAQAAAALDDWAELADGAAAVKLREAAAKLDPHDYSSSLRRALAKDDQAELRSLLAKDPVHELPPVTIVRAVQRLRDADRHTIAIAVLEKAHERHPQDFWIARELGQALFAKDRPARAVGYLRGALEIFSDSPATRNLLGCTYIATSQLEDAEREFRAAVQLQPDYAAAQHNLAFVLLRRQRYDDAAAAMQRTLQAAPDDTASYLVQSSLAAAAGNTDEALEAARQALRLSPEDWLVNANYLALVPAAKLEDDCRRAIAVEPKDARHFRLLGDALSLRKQPKEAQEAYETAIRLRQDDFLAETNLALLLLSNQRFDEAEVHANKAIELNADCTMARLCLAMAQYGKSQLPQCRRTLDAAIERDPYFTFSHLLLGMLLRGQGNLETTLLANRKAMLYQVQGAQFGVGVLRGDKWLSLPLSDDLMTWASAEKKFRKTPSPEQDAASAERTARAELQRAPDSPQALVNLARALVRQNKPVEAEALARQALELDQGNAAAHVVIGMAFFARQDYSSAETWLKRAIEADGGNAEAYALFAIIAEAQGRPAEADAAFRQAVQRDPVKADYPWWLAKLQMKRGEFDSAEASLQEAVRRDGNNALLLFDHATVLRQLGRASEADRTLEAAKRLNPGFVSQLPQLGGASAVQGMFWQAEQAFKQAIAWNIDVNTSQMNLVLLQLLAEDRQGYVSTCRAMLEQSGETANPVEARQTAHACLLQPDIIGDLQQHQKLLQTAKRGVQTMLTNRERALWTYRTGDYAATLALCRQNLAVERDRDTWGYYEIHHRLIEAMSLAQLGRGAEAEFSYCAACRLADAKAPQREHYPGGTWVDWAIFEVTRREAEKTLGLPANPAWREVAKRAVVHLSRGEHEQAASAFAETCAAPGSDSTAWMHAAAARLIVDDQAGYRELCQKMLARFSASDDHYELERLSKVCAILPDAVEPADFPIDQLTAAIDDPKTSAGSRLWLRLARALAAYRQGDHRMAIADTEWIRSADGKPPRAALGMALAVGALAHHSLGEDDLAAQRLTAANELLDSILRREGGKTDYARLVAKETDWLDLTFADVVRQQAATVAMSNATNAK